MYQETLNTNINIQVIMNQPQEIKLMFLWYLVNVFDNKYFRISQYLTKN